MLFEYNSTFQRFEFNSTFSALTSSKIANCKPNHQRGLNLLNLQAFNLRNNWILHFKIPFSCIKDNVITYYNESFNKPIERDTRASDEKLVKVVSVNWKELNSKQFSGQRKTNRKGFLFACNFYLFNYIANGKNRRCYSRTVRYETLEVDK